jgi:hypothetical protein
MFMNARRILVIAAAFAVIKLHAATLSPDGSTLTVAQSQAGGSLVTSAGRWTFGAASNAYGNALLLNGSSAPGHATLLEVANGGQLYAEASNSSWWRWNNTGWSPSPAPTPTGPTGPSKITGVTFDWTSYGTMALGSDNWPTTWSNDDNQYSMWGDGDGFGGAGGKTSFGVARIEGNSGNGNYRGVNRYGGVRSECPELYAQASNSSWWRWNNTGWSSSPAPAASPNASILTVAQSQAGGSLVTSDGTWTFGAASNAYGNAILLNGSSAPGHARLLEVPIIGKSHGAPLSLAGILYTWITPGSGASGYASFSLYKSVDKGCTWAPVGVTFARKPTDISFPSFPSFVQFGKDNGSAIDAYVYTVATSVSDTSSLDVVQRPGNVMLLRVPAASVENEGAYEFFKGLDGNGQPLWSSDASQATAVYKDDDGVGPFAQMSYVPGLGRFVYTNQHGNPSDKSDASGIHSLLTMAEAPQPWGPWTIFYKDLFFPQIEQTVFQWNFAPKWFRNGGHSFTLIFSGTGSNDAWNTVDGTFATSP